MHVSDLLELTLPMPDEQLVFAHTVEALFENALGDKLTAKARDRLKSRGLNLDWKLPAYPRTQFHEWVQIAAEEVHPGIPRGRALEQIGMSVIAGYEKTLLGRALVAAGRLMGPKRTLTRMTHNFRSTSNYLETRLTELGTNSYDLWINETSGVPEYYRGVMIAVITEAGGKDVRVDMRPESGGACTYRISWK
ncbi:MAG: DUF2378 family protein [Myxococcaceae bacterium]